MLGKTSWYSIDVSGNDRLTHFALLQEMSLLSLASFFQSGQNNGNHIYPFLMWNLKLHEIEIEHKIKIVKFLFESAKKCKETFNSMQTNRPNALTSRLHNNDAMLGVKTCRAARTCCAGRALALSASQSVRGPGPARRYDMQELARWLHAWRWRTWQCLVWPQHAGGGGGPFCDIICIRSIAD